MKKSLISIIAVLWLLAISPFIYARGGGGCIESGSLIMTPSGNLAVEQLKPGDKVVSLSGNSLVESRVEAAYSVNPDEYFELIIDGRTLRLTSEHPVEISPGVFRMASFLKTADKIYIQEKNLTKDAFIQSVKRVPAVKSAYNLLVSPYGNYFANGIVVHNKGCFLPETLIRKEDGSESPISSIRPNDRLLAFEADGRLVTATVQKVITHDVNEYCVVTTAKNVVHVTSEHPFYAGNGTFKTLEALKVGDNIFVFDGKGLSQQRIESIKVVKAKTCVYNLQTDKPNTFFANGIAVHNKGGGCFPAGVLINTPGGQIPIEKIQAGDIVMAITEGGKLLPAKVRELYKTRDYVITVPTASKSLRTTAEHPICLSAGKFCAAGQLTTNDQILLWSENKTSSVQITDTPSPLSAEQQEVYNLTVDWPHTFIADDFIVHNKGGGCFPAGVLINTPGGQIPIEKIKAGDLVTAIKKNGKPISVKVQDIYTTRNYVMTVSTSLKSLRTTAEHPICLYTGKFCIAGNLKSDDHIMLWLENKIVPAKLTEQPSEMSLEQEAVYNLTVDWPHTFIADDFVVHNKGGGGFGHSGGGSRPIDETFSNFIFFAIIGIAVIVQICKKIKGSDDENLDFVFDRSTIEKKSGKTLKLLDFISKQDATVNPDTLRQVAKTTFAKLQECWQARDYEPMKALMMPDIYKNHCIQLQGMVRSHEINVIGKLFIENVDIVNIRYTYKENQREFTALITALARDYYIDDRTQEYIRGDSLPQWFQEFWTFQYFDKSWLLREIEQTRESDALKEENFFEQFTDTGAKQIYGDEASKEGKPGPWLEKIAQTKETRIERMLNFLVQTDKIWNRQSMLETTRRTFLEVMAAWQSGNEADIPIKDLFPEVTEHMRQSIAKNRQEGITMEFRNLCNRKVELVLVRNFTDNTKDEFVARIRAHAQKIINRNGSIIHKDEDVTAFEQYLTFGRLDNQWKLKEILSANAGQSVLGQENLDQDSSPQQVQWYYEHNRAI
jgi:predicted lipid-binding transport protein (Tim44 family)